MAVHANHLPLRQIAQDRQSAARMENRKDYAAAEAEAERLHGSRQPQANFHPPDAREGARITKDGENSVSG